MKVGIQKLIDFKRMSNKEFIFIILFYLSRKHFAVLILSGFCEKTISK
jgi:hypothetical protein